MKKILIPIFALGGLAFGMIVGIDGKPERIVPMPEPQPETPKQSAADEERKKLMREIAKKGGQKSVEARRRKKAEREAAKLAEKKPDDVSA